MLKQYSFNSQSVRLNFARSDTPRPPLVLLHGVTGRWQRFLPLLPSLALRWQVHALDLRGHGRSDRTDGKYLVADYIPDVVDFLRGKFSGAAVVYGHSLGALIAAAAAAEVPEEVRAVVLEDPPFETVGPRIGQTPFHSLFAGIHAIVAPKDCPRDVYELARRLAEIEITDPATGSSVRFGEVRDAADLLFIARSLLQVDPAVLEPLIAGRWLEGYDRDNILGRIECPVLLLQADETAGGMLSEADARLAESLITRCTRIHLPGTGHQIHWTEPQITLRLVTGFLESL